jgi:hypothetical protein
MARAVHTRPARSLLPGNASLHRGAGWDDRLGRLQLADFRRGYVQGEVASSALEAAAAVS